MIEITRTEDVFVLTMVAGENRFNPTMLDAFTRTLDEVEASEGSAAVVLTGQGKFFSNGLDLEWMVANADQGGPALVASGLEALYRRLVTFPTATVAAVNGHAFAGGGMLALACDQRVMRTDRGFFCLPEVDINIPFTDGMAKLVQAKLTPSAAYEAMLTGRRFAAAGGTRRRVRRRRRARGPGRSRRRRARPGTGRQDTRHGRDHQAADVRQRRRSARRHDPILKPEARATQSVRRRALPTTLETPSIQRQSLSLISSSTR